MTATRFRPVLRACLATIAFLTIILPAGAQEIFPELVPNPSLAPGEVVRIQLGALPRFIELVKNPVYAPMIDHKAAEYGDAFEQDDHVLVPVMLTGSDNGKAAYLFVLGQQNVDGCMGCWMTESVFRLRVDEADRKSRAIRFGA